MTRAKRCASVDCQNLILREDYGTNHSYRVTRYCCQVCGQQGRNAAKWKAIMAYRVIPGIELELEQIAEIGGVSKQACDQLLRRALQKLSRNPTMRQLAIQVLNIDIPRHQTSDAPPSSEECAA